MTSEFKGEKALDCRALPKEESCENDPPSDFRINLNVFSVRDIDYPRWTHKPTRSMRICVVYKCKIEFSSSFELTITCRSRVLIPEVGWMLMDAWRHRFNWIHAIPFSVLVKGNFAFDLSENGKLMDWKSNWSPRQCADRSIPNGPSSIQHSIFGILHEEKWD